MRKETIQKANSILEQISEKASQVKDVEKMLKHDDEVAKNDRAKIFVEVGNRCCGDWKRIEVTTGDANKLLQEHLWDLLNEVKELDKELAKLKD